MTVAQGYDIVRMRLNEARALLAAPETRWADAYVIQWGRAFDDIERFLDGDESGRGFSIIRQLDSGPGMKSPMGDAVLALASELRRSGVTRYR